MRLGPPPAAGYATTEVYRVTLLDRLRTESRQRRLVFSRDQGLPILQSVRCYSQRSDWRFCFSEWSAPRPGPPARDRPDPAEPVTHPSGAPWHAGSRNTDAPENPNTTAASLTAAPGRNLERAAARPGLSIMATEDHLAGTDEQCRRASARAGAEIAELDGLGPWWFTQDPQRGAAAINRFWAGVGQE
jgi:hypothetical protein